MEKILRLMNAFEKKNNISIALKFYSDGSSTISEFWDEEELCECKNTDLLFSFLENTSYKLNEKGICFSPVQIDK